MSIEAMMEDLITQRLKRRIMYAQELLDFKRREADASEMLDSYPMWLRGKKTENDEIIIELRNLLKKTKELENE